MKWEYLDAFWNSLGNQGPKTRPNLGPDLSLNDWLARLGGEGWEMMSENHLKDPLAVSGGYRGTSYTFKREVRASSDEVPFWYKRERPLTLDEVERIRQGACERCVRGYCTQPPGHRSVR